LVLTNFEFDDGGRDIPGLDLDVLEVLNRLPRVVKTEVFTAKTFDSRFNYEDLEYMGDAALKHAVTHLIKKSHSELDRGWKNVSTI
jgi:dsRNA-specific ribonuclease